MEYPQTTALVPTGEHFDAGAINGALWLTQGHVNNIEQVLQQNADAATQLQQANNTIATLQQAATEQATTLQQATDALATANNTIATLQQQLAAAQAAPAVQVTATTRQGDEVGNAPEPYHLSKNNPFNTFAAAAMPWGNNQVAPAPATPTQS